MGFFNFLKNKKKLEKSSLEKTDLVSNENSALSIKGFTIHEDLKNLVWIGDGKYKSYEQSNEEKNLIEVEGFKITIAFHNQEEPSLIYTNQKINKPKDLDSVERPPYYPTYSDLSKKLLTFDLTI